MTDTFVIHCSQFTNSSVQSNYKSSMLEQTEITSVLIKKPN